MLLLLLLLTGEKLALPLTGAKARKAKRVRSAFSRNGSSESLYFLLCSSQMGLASKIWADALTRLTDRFLIKPGTGPIKLKNA